MTTWTDDKEQELFEAQASLSLEEVEALSSFRMEDDQSFMTEP